MPVETLTSERAAIAAMKELARTHESVSVFWDRGWGDAPLEISIITDDDGQKPHHLVTPEVYRQLVKDKVIAPNSLKTFKARRVHDFSRTVTPEPTGPTAINVAEDVIRSIFTEMSDQPLYAEFHRGLDPNSRTPRIMMETLATATGGGCSWFVRLLPGALEVPVSADGEMRYGSAPLLGDVVSVRYPRVAGMEVDLKALAGPAFRQELISVIKGKLAEISAARGAQ